MPTIAATWFDVVDGDKPLICAVEVTPFEFVPDEC